MEDQVLQNEYSKNRSELWNLSFRDLFYKYVRFLPLFVLSVALSLLAAYIYLRYTVPIYNVGGSMLIKSEQAGNTNDKFKQLFDDNGAQNIQSEIEILKSAPLMKRVVEKQNLQFSYSAVGKIKSVNIYKYGPFLVNPISITDSTNPFTLKIKFNNEKEFKINDEPVLYKLGQVFKHKLGVFRVDANIGKPGSGYYNVTWHPAAQAAAAYAGAIKVVPKVLGTGILNISMMNTNSQFGADVINSLMDEYSGYNIEQKKITYDQTLEFIDDRLKEIGPKLDSIEKRALEYVKSNNMIDADAQSKSYFEIIGESDKIINDQTIQLNVAGMIDNYLVDKKNEYSKVVAPSALGLQDNTLERLVEGYNAAQLERKLLVDGNTPVSHPLVKEKDGQIEKLRLSIRENLKNIQDATASGITKSKGRSGVSEYQLKSMPEKVYQLAEIRKDLEIYKGVYKLLSEKNVETSISRAATVPNSSVINYAVPSAVPVKPNKKSIQIMAILLGIALPALFIFLKEVLNDKVSTRFDIERLTQAPILGEIGHSYSETVLVVDKTSRSMVAEQFRIIRSNLQYVLNKKEKATILVTSSFSGEGKSYVSTNMGAAMAVAGKRTVVLEFDIRKPKVLSGLGMPKGPGISNFLIGKGDLKDLIRPVPGTENLFILGCGPIPPNPAELLLDKRVDEMFEWLQTNFDIVVIDTAPVGMVSDAMTLGKYADATLYLVRQEHTFKKQIILIDEFYKANKLPKVSIIVNDVKLKPGYGYYGYGRYGYGQGYGYGSYYEEEKRPKLNTLDRILSKLKMTRLLKKIRR
jgi:tyrosine-protein kinase Etk/Wzc